MRRGGTLPKRADARVGSVPPLGGDAGTGVPAGWQAQPFKGSKDAGERRSIRTAAPPAYPLGL